VENSINSQTIQASPLNFQNLQNGIIDLGTLTPQAEQQILNLPSLNLPSLQDLYSSHNLNSLNSLTNLNGLNNLNGLDLSSIDLSDLSPANLNLGGCLGGHNSNNLGTNVCGCKREAPRPQPLNLHGNFPSLNNLPTIAPPTSAPDCCSCGRQLIAPAPLPRQGSVVILISQIN
jgi:hypothetical protein